MDAALAAQPSREALFDLANLAKDTFSAGEALRLDASAAEQVPPAVIQLILSIARTARESGAGFTLVTPSAQLVDDFQTFGLFADMMTIAME